MICNLISSYTHSFIPFAHNMYMESSQLKLWTKKYYEKTFKVTAVTPSPSPYLPISVIHTKSSESLEYSNTHSYNRSRRRRHFPQVPHIIYSERETNTTTTTARILSRVESCIYTRMMMVMMNNVTLCCWCWIGMIIIIIIMFMRNIQWSLNCNWRLHI